MNSTASLLATTTADSAPSTATLQRRAAFQRGASSPGGARTANTFEDLLKKAERSKPEDIKPDTVDDRGSRADAALEPRGSDVKSGAGAADSDGALMSPLNLTGPTPVPPQGDRLSDASRSLLNADARSTNSPTGDVSNPGSTGEGRVALNPVDGPAAAATANADAPTGLVGLLPPDAPGASSTNGSADSPPSSSASAALPTAIDRLSPPGGHRSITDRLASSIEGRAAAAGGARGAPGSPGLDAAVVMTRDTRDADSSGSEAVVEALVKRGASADQGWASANQFPDAEPLTPGSDPAESRVTTGRSEVSGVLAAAGVTVQSSENANRGIASFTPAERVTPQVPSNGSSTGPSAEVTGPNHRPTVRSAAARPLGGTDAHRASFSDQLEAARLQPAAAPSGATPPGASEGASTASTTAGFGAAPASSNTTLSPVSPPPPIAAAPSEPLPAGPSLVSNHTATAELSATDHRERLGTAMTDDAFPRVLGVKIGQWTQDGLQNVWLDVHPADMGPVAIQITLDGRQAELNFGVESAAARQIIESSLPELAASLQSAGLTLSGGSISQDLPRSQTGSESPPDQGSGNRAGQSAPGDLSPVAPVQQRSLQGLVDLYA